MIDLFDPSQRRGVDSALISGPDPEGQANHYSEYKACFEITI
jgi:hypothetical protein